MNTNEKVVSFDKKLSVVIDKKKQDAFDMAFFSSYAITEHPSTTYNEKSATAELLKKNMAHYTNPYSEKFFRKTGIPKFSLSSKFITETIYKFPKTDIEDIRKLVSVLKNLSAVIRNAKLVNSEPVRFGHDKKDPMISRYHRLFSVVKDENGYFPIIFAVQERKDNKCYLYCACIGKHIDKALLEDAEKLQNKIEANASIGNPQYPVSLDTADSKPAGSERNVRNSDAPIELSVAQWASLVNRNSDDMYHYFHNGFLSEKEQGLKNNRNSLISVDDFNKKITKTACGKKTKAYHSSTKNNVYGKNISKKERRYLTEKLKYSGFDAEESNFYLSFLEVKHQTCIRLYEENVDFSNHLPESMKKDYDRFCEMEKRVPVKMLSHDIIDSPSSLEGGTVYINGSNEIDLNDAYFEARAYGLIHFGNAKEAFDNHNYEKKVVVNTSFKSAQGKVKKIFIARQKNLEEKIQDGEKDINWKRVVESKVEEVKKTLKEAGVHLSTQQQKTLSLSLLNNFDKMDSVADSFISMQTKSLHKEDTKEQQEPVQKLPPYEYKPKKARSSRKVNIVSKEEKPHSSDDSWCDR